MDRMRLGRSGQSIFGRRAGFPGVGKREKARCYQNMRYRLRRIIDCVEDAIALVHSSRVAGCVHGLHGRVSDVVFGCATLLAVDDGAEGFLLGAGGHVRGLRGERELLALGESSLYPSAGNGPNSCAGASLWPLDASWWIGVWRSSPQPCGVRNAVFRCWSSGLRHSSRAIESLRRWCRWPSIWRPSWTSSTAMMRRLRFPRRERWCPRDVAQVGFQSRWPMSCQVFVNALRAFTIGSSGLRMKKTRGPSTSPLMLRLGTWKA